jgi:UDP-glucose 4-epimerase
MAATLLVTGGAGYVGSHCVAALLEAGHRVTVLDNFSTGHRAAVAPDAELVELDLGNRQALDHLFASHRFDGVLHFAANSLVGESMRQPFLYLRDNVVNALNLIEASIAHGVGKFVLSSTANLFGMPERQPIDESAKIEPGSPYGESKAIIERCLHWSEQTKGLRYACLRYFNAAGAHSSGQLGEAHDPETHLIPLVLEVAAGTRPVIEVFGRDYATPDGTCVRDYIHVMDLADAHIKALDLLERRSCYFNLGNGQGYSVLEVIETARQVTGRPISVRFGPRRPGDPAVLVASSAAIAAELGWTPRYPALEDIIRTAWNWHHGKARHRAAG